MVLNAEAVAQRCYVKKWSYKFRNIYRKKLVIESLKEETLAPVFSCEFWEICKNTFFIKNLPWLLLSIRLWTNEISFAITIQTTIQHFLAQKSSIVLNRQHKRVINFSSIKISPHWISSFEVYFTAIIFYYVGKTLPDVQWRDKKAKLSRTWRGKFFSSIWVLE